MPVINEKDKEYLTPNEVAKLLMVSPITVRQWAQKGELTAMTTPGGHRRFRRADLLRFAKQRGLALAIHDDSSQRVLIVDDHDVFARSLVEHLDSTVPTVVTELASDSFEAGRKIQTFKPHIVLLDLMMPGMNGFEVCHRLKSDPSTKAIRVIGMTGDFSADNKARIMATGAETCLLKPFDRATLLAVIGLDADISGSLRT